MVPQFSRETVRIESVFLGVWYFRLQNQGPHPVVIIGPGVFHGLSHCFWLRYTLCISREYFTSYPHSDSLKALALIILHRRYVLVKMHTLLMIEVKLGGLTKGV